MVNRVIESELRAEGAKKVVPYAVLLGAAVGGLFSGIMFYQNGKIAGKNEERTNFKRDVSNEVTRKMSGLSSKVVNARQYGDTNVQTEGLMEGIYVLKEIDDYLSVRGDINRELK